MRALPHVVFAAALLAWPTACRGSASQCTGGPRPAAAASAAASVSSRPAGERTEDGHTPDAVIMMRVTAYCPCRQCCGPRACGVTASGQHVSTNGGYFVAADRSIPFGTLVCVPGYAGGRPVPVLDRGGTIRGQRIDVFFPSHQQARAWGVRWLPVTNERVDGRAGRVVMAGLPDHVGRQVLLDVRLLVAAEAFVTSQLARLHRDQTTDILGGQRFDDGIDTHGCLRWPEAKGDWVSAEAGADRLRHPPVQEKEGVELSPWRHPTPSA